MTIFNKNMFIHMTKKIQVDVYCDYGPEAYKKVSGDSSLHNLPCKIDALWTSPNEFSYKYLIEFDKIKNLSNYDLLKYYFQLFIMKNKLIIEFHKIKIKKIRVYKKF